MWQHWASIQACILYPGGRMGLSTTLQSPLLYVVILILPTWFLQTFEFTVLALNGEREIYCWLLIDLAWLSAWRSCFYIVISSHQSTFHDTTIAYWVLGFPSLDHGLAEGRDLSCLLHCYIPNAFTVPRHWTHFSWQMIMICFFIQQMFIEHSMLCASRFKGQETCPLMSPESRNYGCRK